MDTRLTLADVRPILAPMIDSSDLNNPLFLQILNEVMERFINSGKWKGSIMTLRFESSTGFITMPYNYAAALALTYDRYPFPIFTEFHQYVEEGPGKMDETLNWPGILIDLGDGGAIRALRVEDTINLSDIGRDTFNVLADVDSSRVESVIFLLDGAPFCPRGNCVENVAPYFMGGDQGGNPYDDWDWSELLGTHTLTAIPCTGDGGTGDCFAPVEVRLTIVR